MLIISILSFISFTTYVAGSPLVGDKQCTWGPSYWCSHIDHAKECGAVQHCLQNVWKNQVIQVQSTETCTYCMLLVGQLRSALQDKATEGEIANTIANACELLPAGTDRKVCKGIVEDDLPIVMELLLSKITPSMACYTVGFCSVPDKSEKAIETTEMTTAKTTAISTTPKGNNECEDCKKFIQDLKDTLVSNETVSSLKQIIDAFVCQNLGPFAQECQDLVAQFLPIVLAFLADEIDDDVFCRSIGFCAIDGGLPFQIPGKNVFENWSPYKSSEECEICKDILTQITSILRDKTYTDKAKYFLENNVCSMLGSLKDECKQLVEEYFPQLLELLVNELDPTTVCESLGMCKVPGGKLSLKPLLESLQPKTVSSNGIECEICEHVASELDSLLQQNATEEGIRDMLDKVCKRLPDAMLTSKCDDLVKKYEDDIIKFLLKEFDPKKLCTTLGFCSKSSKDMKKAPAETKDFKLKDDAKCTLCKFAVQFVQSLIQNMTAEQILEDVEKVCKIIPSANISALCDKYVKEYGPFAVDLLMTSKPEVLCGFAKLCGTGETAVPTFMVPIPEDPVKETEKESVSQVCQICNTVVMVIKELVDQNMTKEEIENELKTLCDKIPTVGEECKLLVGLYGGEIIDYLLNKLDPYTVCKELDLCKASKIEAVQPLMTGILTPLDMLPLQLPLQTIDTASKTPITGETTCVLCKTILNSLDDILEQKSSQESIRKALESVCTDILPSSMTKVCLAYVDKYTPVILNYIVLNLDADVICKVAKMCPAEAQTEEPKLVHVPLMKDDTVLSRNLGAKSSNVECDVCEAVMTKIEELIGENATEAEIKAALEKVCDQLPSYQTQCKNLVEEYGDIVIKMLLKIKPDQVCKTLGFCSKGLTRNFGSKASDIECEGCQIVIGKLIQLIGDNRTEEGIKAALEKLCSELPSSYASQCKALVEEYEDMLLKLLQSELDPKQICTQLGLCSQSKFQPLVASVHLIPSNPSSETGISRKLDVKASDVECEACEVVVTELIKLIGENKSEENIKAALEKVCSLLPSSVASQCKAFVEEYADLVLDLLKQALDPKEICQKLGLCSQMKIESHIPAKSSKIDSTASVECIMCEFVINQLDKLIGQNKSEANIVKALEKVCSILPKTVSAECKAFVDEYGPMVIKLLMSELDPQLICTQLQLCSQAEIQRLSSVFQLIQDKILDKTGTGDSVQCELCEMGARYLKTMLDSNVTQEELEDLLDRLCDLFPDTVTAQCHAVVKQYVPAILDLIKEDINTTQFCQTLGLCSSDKNLVLKPSKPDTVPMVKLDDALYFKPRGHMLGEDECTYGPAFWCKDEQTARRCNAWEHCERHVWNRN